MLNNLLNNCKITRVHAGGAGVASATPTKCSILDMSGYKSVCFIAEFGDVLATSEVALKIATADTNDTGAMSLVSGAEVGGTAGVSDYDDKLVILDVTDVGKQFIECQVFHVTANAPFDSVIAVQYNPVNAPVTQGGTVVLSDTVTA
ncbi:hypothetical protein [Nitrosomonas communis]|uniref:hypothetical protein n=1 Tax=Nitrosomonas communis TaxID=44574 RepID=UPI003D2DB2AD